MREALRPLLGKKTVFSTTFVRFGWKVWRGQFEGKTLLLRDVKDTKGRILTDHIWFRAGKRFDKLGLEPGDAVSFHARVGTYKRGGRDSDDFDYHLEYPEHLTKLNDERQGKLDG